MAVKLKLHKTKINEAVDNDSTMDDWVDGALSRMIGGSVQDDDEPVLTDDPVVDEPSQPVDDIPAEEKPYITPDVGRVIKHGNIEDLRRRRENRRLGITETPKAAGAVATDAPEEDAETEFQKRLKIQAAGKQADFFKEADVNSAVEEIKKIFRIGNVVSDTVNYVEKTLEQNLVTVAVRFKGSAERGTQSVWSSQSTSGNEAYSDLVAYRKSKKSSASIAFIWFTDFCDKRFIEEFFSGDIAKSFENSGTTIRLSYYSDKVIQKLNKPKYFTTLIFGARFDFDIEFTEKPKGILLDPEKRKTDKKFIKELGILNFNFINVLDNIPGLCRLIVDKDHPDFCNDKRFNLIRKTPINFKDLDTLYKKTKKKQYIYDQMYLIQDLNQQANVLWYAPSTWASDNKNLQVYDRDGKVREVTTSGTNPGVFNVPDGITALNPFCFGQNNPFIRTLNLPASLEVEPKFLYSFLPYLEKVNYAGKKPTNIPVGAYMDYKPRTKGKELVIEDEIDIIEDLAFANSEASRIIFQNPDDIYYIGRQVFETGAVNPFKGYSYGKLYNHVGEEQKFFVPNRIRIESVGQNGIMGRENIGITSDYNYKELYLPTQNLPIPNYKSSYTNDSHCYNGNLKFTNVLEGSNLTIIGVDAFAGCHNLEFTNGRLIIPDTVEKIGHAAFADVLERNEEVFIPASIDLDNIGDCAFYISREFINSVKTDFLSANVDALNRPTSMAIDRFEELVALKKITCPKALDTDKQKFLNMFGLTAIYLRALGVDVNFI